MTDLFGETITQPECAASIKRAAVDNYGRLTIVSMIGASHALCACSCGKAPRVYKTASLRNGSTKSCGCLHRELLAARSTTHGLSKHPRYGIWKGMRRRCQVETDGDYANYGGRGVSVCQRWDESFEAFAQDMGPRPPETSIERLENSGNYEPGNCIWATATQQRNNTRTNFVIEHAGKSQTLAQWAREIGVAPDAISARIRKLGWAIGKALSTPVRAAK